MNKVRRKTLEELRSEIEDVILRLEEMSEEESNARDNTPESLQGTERYDRLETSASALEEALDNLGYVIDNITEAIDA